MREQRVAAAEARLQRGDYLVAVAARLLEPTDLLEAALAPTNKALRPLRLSQVFGPPAEYVPAAQRQTYLPWPTIRRRLLEALELAPLPDKTLTVGWLLDPRAGGRRWLALCDALRPRHEGPWPGFPWEPRP